MAQSIPISQVVTINPGVVGTGSNPLALNGIFLGKSNLIPVGAMQTFYSADAVGAWFGTSSYEYSLAQVYFNGFLNAKKYPAQIKFYAYADAARGAWARAGSLKGVTLATLKTYTGTLTVTIAGTAYNADSFNLSTATSFTNAAELIETALGIATVGSVEWDATTSRFVISVTDTGADSTISAVTGTMAASLKFDTATLSQGADVTSLTDTLNACKVLDLNWATVTLIEQLTADEMTEMAVWANAQNSRYLAVISDNDADAKMAGSESHFGYEANVANYDGIALVYDANTNPLTKAFIMGCAASIDWKQTNGRITFAFRQQSGLPATVDALEDAQALLANGYSYYGAYAGSGEENTYAFLYDGNIPGKFKWIDTYINQVYLNSQLQKAITDMLLAVNSMPYNTQGYTMLRNAILDPVAEALNNGTIRAGIPLSNSQKTQIITQVGYDITRELYTDGWYLQIKDADAQTRGNRQSPPMNFFYCDGGSIQQVTLPSIAVL